MMENELRSVSQMKSVNKDDGDCIHMGMPSN